MRDSAVRCELTCRYELARVVPFDPSESPFLRLSEADRYALGVKWLLVVLAGTMLFRILS